MLSFAIFTLALTASARPLGPINNSTISSPAIVGRGTACPTDGSLVCNGPNQFGLCDHGSVIFQSVAAGTACQNGAIVASGGSAPAAPAVVPVSNTAAPASSHLAAATPSSAPASSSSGSAPTTLQAGGYHMYSGNGAVSAGWPAQSAFLSFDALWALNEPIMTKSCDYFQQPNNSPQEIADIKNAILSVSQTSGIDKRFILSILMQESHGCTRAWTTNYGVNNPGLMQSHDGTGSCNLGLSNNSVSVTTPGPVKNPCPASDITQMIHDGVMGTPSGDGLKQTLAQAGNTTVARFYRAARIYNSGSVAPSGMLGQGIATHCYSSDIANRLLGKLTGGASACKLDKPPPK